MDSESTWGGSSCQEILTVWVGEGVRKGGVSLRATWDGESITITGHEEFEDHGCRCLSHLVTAAGHHTAQHTAGQ